MQRFFSIVIIFAILVVGGGWLLVQKSNEDARVRIEERLADARRSFADRARSAASEEDNEAYVRGIKAALSSYQDELKKQVYDEKPEWRNADAYVEQVELQFKEGQLNEAQRKSMKEGFAIVKEAHDRLKSGNWKPILTQVGPGDTRLDIYEMKKTRDDEGNPILEGKFFFWGVEDSTRMQWGQLGLRYWTTSTEMVKEGRKKVEKEVEKVLGRAEGDATPRLIIQNPHRYIAEFPSYVSPGYIWFPAMPREAQDVDIEYSYVAKKGGGAHDAMLKWEKMKIPANWQLREGETWDADVIEATAEEIAGKDPNAPEGEEAPE